MAKTEYRWRRDAGIRLMARAEGYCMVRYKGAMPFCIPEKEWENLPVLNAKDRNLPTAADVRGILNPERSR